MNETAGHDGRATVREVYDLVDKTRAELGERIDGLGDRIDTLVTSHEHRLTVVEATQGAHAEQIARHDQRLDELGNEIGTLRDRQRADEAATNAIAAADATQANNRKWVIATAIAVAGVIATLAYVLISVR